MCPLSARTSCDPIRARGPFTVPDARRDAAEAALPLRDAGKPLRAAGTGGEPLGGWDGCRGS